MSGSNTSIPWLRLTIEGLAIVASILIAFAIDAWWQSELEEGEEHQILISLQDEFQAHRATLERKEADWTKRKQSIERLLQAMHSGEMPPPAVMDTLLDDLTYPSTWDPGSGARDALIASGRLELIDNLDLRNRLSAWEGTVDEVRDNEQSARDMILTILNPFIAEHGVPMDRLLATTNGSWPVPLASDLEAERAYRSLLADPAFENYAAIRYVWLQLHEYREAIEFADSVLVAIRAELNE